MKKRVILDLENIPNTALVSKALSAEIRLDILKCLVEKASNISEIAKMFDLPLSSCALHIKILEEAGLILVKEIPGVRGTQKLCGVAFEDVYFNVFAHHTGESAQKSVSVEMPIGNYFDCQVSLPCGIVSEKAYLGYEDFPYSFYGNERLNAQLIWFECGYLEYRFPTNLFNNSNVSELCFSFEVCSEAPGYNNDWPSDITVWVNSSEVATLHSKGDFGDHQGRNNPDWWSPSQSQYGVLTHIKINAQGSFDNGVKCSGVTLDDLNITDNYFVSFKIGVKSDAENIGGLNLFGEKFGDYSQAIVMKVSL